MLLCGQITRSNRLFSLITLVASLQMTSAARAGVVLLEEDFGYSDGVSGDSPRWLDDYAEDYRIWALGTRPTKPAMWHASVHCKMSGQNFWAKVMLGRPSLVAA